MTNTAPDPGYAVGPAARSYRAPVDVALRELAEAIDVALAAGAGPSSILGKVANGLAGEVNGYRARALTRAMADAAVPVLDASIEDLKAAERAR